MARQGWNEEDTYRAQDATSWGGFAGRPNDPNGNPGGIASGAAQDVNRYRGMGEAAANRQAYQNNWGNANAYARQAQGARGAQGMALALQAQAAMGQAPSAAQALGQNMLDQSLQAQMAGAASARGGSLAQAAAMRNAAQGAGAMQMQGMNQMSALRAQEMAQARGDFMQGASGMRGHDFQAQGLAQQQNAMDMQSELTQRGLNQQAQMGYEQMGYNVNAAQQAGALQKAQMDEQRSQFEKELAYRRKEKSDDRAWNAVGGVIGGIGSFFSDKNAKMPLTMAGYAQPGPGGMLQAPPGLAAAAGYRDNKYALTGQNAGDMFLPPEQIPIPSPDEGKVPVLAPGSGDWERYGKAGEKDMKAAMTGGQVTPVDWDNGGADQEQGDVKDRKRAGAGLSAFADGATGKKVLSDMTAKQPMMLSDMMGKAPLAYSDERAKMPTGVMGYEDGARIGPDGLGYVEQPSEATVVPAKFAAMQAAKESGGSSLAKAAAGKGSAKKRDLDAESDELLRQVRAQYAGYSKAGPAIKPSMADAARAMEASAYAYKPGMQPPEQAPGEPNVGPMAQNMAANPVTATAIKKDPRSGMLMIDQSKMTKVLGGVVADQQRQIDSLAALVTRRGK